MAPKPPSSGGWLLRSGIQEPNGGVARYYHADLKRNQPVSTEITGYAASAFVYLHSVTGEERYLERARAAATFLTRTAWDGVSETMPFELSPARFTYFFDCGIVVRGLLAAWRSTGTDEFLDVAAVLGKAMAEDFPGAVDTHPILSLPGKHPVARDPLRWSQSPGCYQLKSAMAWWDLAEATGDRQFRAAYDRVLEQSLRSSAAFLPGHPDRLKVMDRLHAFLYFLEGLLPRANDPRCAAVLCAGIQTVAGQLREIAPLFERSDVYAQLLRIRLYAGWAGAAPLDRAAAQSDAEKLLEFEIHDADPRIDGGFLFGRQGETWLPYINPVSTAFALQALTLWDAPLAGSAPLDRHMLI